MQSIHNNIANQEPNSIYSTSFGYDSYEKREKMFIFKVQIIIPHNFRNTVSLTAENMPVGKYLRFDSITVCWAENHFLDYLEII